ncbi:hypothetical protein M2390_002249 [Mycetocola sp. BIGb0189]|uniref:SAP domain-containing protein n=1 Tax=Mycetocola sp. BIGb0189 TaxID=2940604 RepID=UPI002167F4B8|nr:hypothetical protein [Mycetocola sp. BIGb0189]MCS4277055.1 hypothetical protein [Mycetocola sp. BIGb0189]
MSPDSFGLFPHELLLLNYAPKILTGKPPQQQFWQYRYGVSSPMDILRNLESRGFLEVAGIDHSISAQTLPMLKSLLTKLSLSPTGSKAKLVARILEEVSLKELNQYFPERYFGRTVLGQAAIDASPHILYIHQNAGIEDLDIFSLTEQIAAHGGSYRQVLWNYVHQAQIDHTQRRDFGLARNAKLRLSYLLAEENRFVEAIAMLAEVFFSDVNGSTNGFNMDFLAIYAENFFPYDASTITIAPGLPKHLTKWIDQAGISESEAREIMAARMQIQTLPLSVFTPEECIDLVFLTISGEQTRIKQLYIQAETLFLKRYSYELSRG